MVVYKTRNSEYPTEKIGEADAIVFRGNKYKVLGSYDPTKHNLGKQGDSFIFDGKKVSLEDLSQSLEKVRFGNCIVGRRVDEQGNFVDCPHQLMVTSAVAEIK